MFAKMCDNFKELSETYFRFSLALLRAEFGFLTKFNDSTTMKGKCYAITIAEKLISEKYSKTIW